MQTIEWLWCWWCDDNNFGDGCRNHIRTTTVFETE